LEVIIYHIPQITLVPISPALVHDLQRTYPHQVVAVKDSSGDWDNTVQLLENPDLAVLIGDERHLAKAAPLGCAGAISGMANLFPQRLKQILASGQRDAALFDLVDAVVTQPVTPAIKAIVGQMYGDESWQRVRAPLEQTPQAALLALSKLLSPMLSETVR
jgi:4-hydroxy-tetrahydrodipicolinate synthase